MANGAIHLVGTGPGDYGLLTLRAMECLTNADLLIHDQDTPERVLACARKAQRVGVAVFADSALLQRIIDAARSGAGVVCLGPGDRITFDRNGDTAKALAAAGVPWEIVPGVRHPIEWSTRRPLADRHIVVTRPAQQAESMMRRLELLGACVYSMPTVEIGPAPDAYAVDQAIERLPNYDWLVFTSGNGVEALVERILAAGRDLRVFGGIKLAAIGPKTAAALARFHLFADLVPTAYRSEELANALLPRVNGQKVLLARADRGRDLLREQLAAVAEVEHVAVYSQRDVNTVAAPLLKRIQSGGIDWITVTSSNIAHACVRLVNPLQDETIHTRLRFVSISPVTSSALRSFGCEPAAEAKVYTESGIIDAILDLAAREATVIRSTEAASC